MGVVAVTTGATERPQEHAVADDLDKLHSARPVAAHKVLDRFGVPGRWITAVPTAADLYRFYAGVKAAKDLVWYQGVAAAEKARRANATRPFRSTGSRRVVRSTRSSGGSDVFACIRHHESRGDYGAVNRSSGAAGAYQFMRPTWNNAARASGRGDLVGVNPAAAAPSDQDAMAHYVYSTQGARPWTGSGCS
jgi:hypothetical protein